LSDIGMTYIKKNIDNTTLIIIIPYAEETAHLLSDT